MRCTTVRSSSWSSSARSAVKRGAVGLSGIETTPILRASRVCPTCVCRLLKANVFCSEAAWLVPRNKGFLSHFYTFAWRGVRGVRGVWVYDTVIQRGGWSCITVVLQRGYTARPSTRGAVHRRTAGRALRGGSCMVVGVLTIGPQSSGWGWRCAAPASPQPTRGSRRRRAW